jgi:hypothetical protein
LTVVFGRQSAWRAIPASPTVTAFARKVLVLADADLLVLADAALLFIADDGLLERVANFSALFAAVCPRPLPSQIVISLMCGTKGLSN